MTELLFIVTEDQSGHYDAHAVGQSIYTQADSDTELERNVREAVRAHFDAAEQLPRVLHLHFVRDKTIPLLTGEERATSADLVPLRGSVLSYDDPFAPACPPEDWDANR